MQPREGLQETQDLRKASRYPCRFGKQWLSRSSRRRFRRSCPHPRPRCKGHTLYAAPLGCVEMSLDCMEVSAKVDYREEALYPWESLGDARRFWRFRSTHQKRAKKRRGSGARRECSSNSPLGKPQAQMFEPRPDRFKNQAKEIASLTNFSSPHFPSLDGLTSAFTGGLSGLITKSRVIWFRGLQLESSKVGE